MKKRTMKKWIPKNTCYCENCKWRRINKTKNSQENGYCMYLGTGDWVENGTDLIWDGCKDCGEHMELHELMKLWWRC